MTKLSEELITTSRWLVVTTLVALKMKQQKYRVVMLSLALASKRSAVVTALSSPYYTCIILSPSRPPLSLGEPKVQKQQCRALLLLCLLFFVPLFCRSALGDIWKLPLLDAGSDNGSSLLLSRTAFPIVSFLLRIRQPSFPPGDQYAYFFRP